MKACLHMIEVYSSFALLHREMVNFNSVILALINRLSYTHIYLPTHSEHLVLSTSVLFTDWQINVTVEQEHYCFHIQQYKYTGMVTDHLYLIKAFIGNNVHYLYS